jgi:superfamily II DNA or RNA helicase
MPFGDEKASWENIEFIKVKLKALRPDQQTAVNNWEKTRRGVIVMPTGAGKTEVALHIVRNVSSHTLFIAPTRALAYQLTARIEEAFKTTVGFIGDNTYRLAPLSVATYDSAAIKMEFIGNYFELLVFDECHHLPGDFYSDAARMSAAPYRLGLTATPIRSDGGEKHYEHLIGPICYEMPIAEARGTILAKYKIKKIPVLLTDEEQREYDALGITIAQHISNRKQETPNYSWEDVTKNMASDPEARHAFHARLKRRSIEEHASEKLSVLEDLMQVHNQQVVVFTGSNIMARKVSARFLIPCLLATTGKKERQVILDGYRRGDFQAIIANRVLNEGVDVPRAKVGIIIGGTGSEREAIQRLGRILRKQGVEGATLYEVVCAGTGEEQKSRKRRRNDAYKSGSSL